MSDPPKDSSHSGEGEGKLDPATQSAISSGEEGGVDDDGQPVDEKVSQEGSVKGDNVSEVEGTKDVSVEEKQLMLGLIPDDEPAMWMTHDLVLVHGICQTKWTTDERRPLWNKESSGWLKNVFYYCRFLHFYYDIEGDDDSAPALFYRGGVEKEALKLLDGLVELRNQFDEKVGQAEPRPIMFIAHDLGGIVVKKALILASLNPAKYGDIPYLTSVLIFLGCPHRGDPYPIGDQVAKLLLLPNPSFHDNLIDKVNSLATTIIEVNGEFLDTKILIRASIFNVYNEGVKKSSGDKDEDGNKAKLAEEKEKGDKDAKVLPVPFENGTTTFDSPFEFFFRCEIPHLDLVLGGSDDSDFGNKIGDVLDKFPYFTKINEAIAGPQRLLLSQAPPFIPIPQDELYWQPYLVEEWVVETLAFKKWRTARGLNVLHIHGSSDMAVKSQEVFQHLQGDLILDNMLYFEFKRYDCRFNNLLAMLASFMAQIVSRYQMEETIKSGFEMLIAHRAWTLRDLLQLFESLQDSHEMKPIVYMIACVDECDESQSVLLEQLLSLREISEKDQKFIITSGADERLMDALSPWSAVNIDEFPMKDKKVWTSTFDSTYSYQLRALFDTKPIFAKFEGTVRDILQECGSDYRLGHLIIRWLVHQKQKTTKAGIQKTLEGLMPVTPESVLETILSSFDTKNRTRARNLLSLVKCSFRPLTIWELGIGLKLADESGEDALEDVDYDDLRDEVRQFGRVLWSNGNEVDFWYPSYVKSREDPKAMASLHGEMARLSLRYLSFPGVKEEIKAFCHCHTHLDRAPVCLPRRNLIWYAVKYWPSHYKMAGSSRPEREATDFFQNRDNRNTWAQAHYVLSNPATRIYKSYISPLPIISMSGLDDLVGDQISRGRSTATFKTDCSFAIVEAARFGHNMIVQLLLQACSPTREALSDAVSAVASFGEGAALEDLVEYASKVEGFRWPSGLLGRVAWLGLAKIAKALIEFGIEVNPSNALYSNSPIHLAVDARHTAVVEVLIRAKCDVNGRVESGYTPLHLAATRGNPEIVKLLLDSGAELEAKTTGPLTTSLTPLQLAATGGKLKALKVLLEAGADTSHGLDGDDAQAWEAKPLVHAATMGYTECVRLLLEHDADVKAVLGKRTALYHAAAEGHVEVCRLLLEKGADPNENPAGFDLILLVAVEDENIDLVTLFLDSGARIEEEDSIYQWRNTALSRAAGTTNKELVELLLKRGADVNHCGKDSQFPLYVASFNGHADLVNLLIDNKADVNKPLAESGWCPLHAAYDNLDIVRILLKRGAEIDQLCNAGTVLYLAAKYNQPQVLKLLLEQDPKPDLEIQTKAGDDTPSYEDGMTALCIACYKGNIDIMMLLLEAGANVNHKTRDGSFPLEFCLDTEGKADELMQALLEFRPELTQADDAGNTVLHSITWRTPLSVVKLLYIAGADISAANMAGETPLTKAMSADNPQIATYLLSRGANPNTYAPDSGTPLHIAASAGSYDLFKALIDAGADVSRADISGYKETLLYSAGGGFLTETRLEIMKYLVKEAQVDVNAKSKSDFVYALLNSTINHGGEAVRYLLDNGADPNKEDGQGRRAIHLAAFRFTDSISPLIEAGAEISIETKLKMTPLHFAAAGNRLDENIDPLLDANSSVDIPDIDDWTPLLWAVKGSYQPIEMIEKLLEREASLWVRGKGIDREWSPLKASRYYRSSEEVYDLLVPKEKRRVLPSGEEELWDDEFHKSKEADFKSSTLCKSCLMTVVGIDYSCSSCNFHLCYKCYRSKDILHPGHDFQEIGPEYAATSPSPERPSSIIGDEGGATPFTDHGLHDAQSGSDIESAETSDFDKAEFASDVEIEDDE